MFKLNKRKVLTPLIEILILVLLIPSVTCLIKLFFNNNKSGSIASYNNLLVHFISVGQADAIAINFPNGEVAVIDTGSEYSNKKVVDYINNYVISNKHNKKIDHLFYTHADTDHTGGLIALLNNYDCLNIYRPLQYASFEQNKSELGQIVDNENYEKAVDLIYKETKDQIFIENNLNFYVGEVLIQIFYPVYNRKDSNEYSYFIKLSYKSKSVLFTGDVTAEGEEYALSQFGSELDSDVLKVAHHGSDSSSSLNFLNAVSAETAVISVGKNNFGHPTSAVLNNLTNSGVKNIYRTDSSGNVLIEINKDILVHQNDYFISNF
ncbi:MAG: MBL fold metallo-hydrolase [Clostridia bacterium]|nr:MBL fold metallo-hydrolase [Clostridia bacterium]